MVTMAASAAMQSLLASSITSKTRVNKLVPLSYAPHRPKSANMKVRSMAKQDDDKDISTPESTQPNPAPTPESTRPNPASSPSPAPARAPKVSTKFEDIFAFSGPGPERINGRLAMIGFVTAIGVEIAKGQDLFSQIADGGLPWFIGTSVVLSLASLVPLFKGVRAEGKTEGLMTSDAELWNGRFAMLGLVALAFTEYVIGGTLV